MSLRHGLNKQRIFSTLLAPPHSAGVLIIMRTLLVTFFILITLTSVTGQERNYNADDFRHQNDSLSAAKKEFLKTKESLMKEIREIKKKSADLDEEIRVATLEIEKLYTNKFGKEFGLRIYNKQIWKGMTDKMLQASWGKPDRIDKNVEKWGTFTQWYYGKITFFFRDGKLTDWEELK